MKTLLEESEPGSAVKPLNRTERASKPGKEPSRSTPQKKRTAVRKSAAGQQPAETKRIDPKELRKRLGLKQAQMARLLQISQRQLSSLENHPETASPQTTRKIKEFERLYRGLEEVMDLDPQFLGEWFETPNEGFGNLKPLEVIERGEIDRLWRMIYYLGSGAGA